jgi:hypothetical protein
MPRKRNPRKAAVTMEEVPKSLAAPNRIITASPAMVPARMLAARHRRAA